MLSDEYLLKYMCWTIEISEKVVEALQKWLIETLYIMRLSNPSIELYSIQITADPAQSWILFRIWSILNFGNIANTYVMPTIKKSNFFRFSSLIITFRLNKTHFL